MTAVDCDNEESSKEEIDDSALIFKCVSSTELQQRESIATRQSLRNSSSELSLVHKTKTETAIARNSDLNSNRR